jgi:phenylacetate-CoA ligase
MRIIKLMQTIYDKMPPAIQNVLLSSYSFYINFERYGKEFEKRYEEFDQHQWMDYDHLIDYQNKLLGNLIKHVYENVPYYSDLMRREKLKPDDIQKTEDLIKLPILTRNDIKINFKQLIAKNLSKMDMLRLVKGHTSGTTGSPLEFYWDRNTCIANNVVDWRQKSWAGINMFERCAVILGRTIVPNENRKPPFWRTNMVHNTLWLSAFHMSGDNLPLYIKKLREYKPKYIEGYPSTLYVLAKFLRSNNDYVPLQSAFTSSETLHPVQREIIEEAFQTRLYDFYGLAERVVFATECNEHLGKHLNMDFGITEVIDKDNRPVENGNIGWLTATGLHNYAMPLIRYKTNDVTAIKKNMCSCGRGFPLMEDVTTKAEDVITTPDGRYISSSILTHPFKPLVNIVESQIIQEDVANIRIKIVRGSAYNDEDSKILLKEMENRIGDNMKLSLEFVDQIARTSSGKFRWVVSKVPLQI